MISKKQREIIHPSFLQTLSNRIPALITVYDIQTGTYLYVNDAIKSLLGYTPNEFLRGGISFVTSLVHPDDLKQLLEENTAAIKKANKKDRSAKQDNPIVTFEYRLLHKNGTYRWMHTDGVVFARNAQGKVTQVMNISVDITEHKDAQTALLLKQKQAVTLRDDFLSIASHELKTPITSLKVYLQILERRLANSGNSEVHDYVSKIDRQVSKLTGLIKDLLDVTKIQSGQLAFTMEKFYLKELVTEVIEMTAQTTKKHKFIVKGSDGKKVTGDRDRLGQVITNLLTNAIKYSPNAEKIVVTIKPEKDTISLSVRDFGIGIGKKHQARIFDRFYRVSDLSERTFPGLGIGLFISNQIIVRHGGVMNVKSKKGKGSTFGFRIPYNGLAPHTF